MDDTENGYDRFPYIRLNGVFYEKIVRLPDGTLRSRIVDEAMFDDPDWADEDIEEVTQ